MGVLSAALDQAGHRGGAGERADKKNYAERFSRAIATLVANGLRPTFAGITPDEDGRRQEAPARTAKGFKKLDVNYSTTELGLGLGVSIKTINFADSGSSRFTKNFTRVDNELRAEATDYHQRQPYSVLVAVLFLPIEACQDGVRDVSSFGQAIRIFRHRGGREDARDEPDRFERVFVALYEHDGERHGDVVFFDVMDKPPKQGPPTTGLGFEGFVARVVETYDERNNPPFEWADA